MSFEGFQPIVMETFGGRVTLPDNSLEVPFGFAADELNCDFKPGRVFKRPGLTSVMGPFSGQFRAIDEYVTLAGDRRLLLLGNDGSIKKESGAYTTSTIDSNLYQVLPPVTPGMVSTTLFGRQFIAFSEDWTKGHLAPRHYNDTYLDRVAPSGPGEPPTLTDGGAGGGSEAGAYRCRVFFVTRSGYYTAPSPPSLPLTLAAGHKINVANIPIGPSNIVSRILAFTPVDETGNYFFIPGTTMQIADNTTTSVTGINFQDTALIAATPVSSSTDPEDDLLRQIELPPQAGVVAYKNRLAWWGERNYLVQNGDDGLYNMSFDGGFIGSRPTGWTEIASGESRGEPGGAVHNTLKITGDGTNQKGRLQNQGIVLGHVPAGKLIKIRVRASVDTTDQASAGTLHFFWTGTGAPVADFSIDVTAMSASEWRVFEGTILTAADNKPVSDWRFNLTSGGTGYGGTAINSTKAVHIDSIALFVDEEPVSGSLVRWSKVDDPEAYDGTFGIMNVAENNGQSIRAAFVLRDNIYFVKERSIYMTRDNGSTEPNEWTVEEISATVGTSSPRGVATGDGWAIIAARSGLYMFDGGVPIRISDKIQPDWDRINWDVGNTIWTKVDVESKRIFVGVCLDGDTDLDYIYYCRYDGDEPSTASNWSIWHNDLDPSANPNGLHIYCCVFSERGDGTRQTVFGLAGYLAKLDPTVKNDLVILPINSFYKTAPFGSSSGRNLIGYITMNVYGVGSLRFRAVDALGIEKDLRAVAMQNPSDHDVERIVRLIGERWAFKWGTTGLDQTWSMQKFVAYVNRKVGSPARGYGD